MQDQADDQCFTGFQCSVPLVAERYRGVPMGLPGSTPCPHLFPFSPRLIAAYCDSLFYLFSTEDSHECKRCDDGEKIGPGIH